MNDTSPTHPTASPSHHIYHQVITYITKSWHIKASHNALERVMTHMNDISPTHPTASNHTSTHTSGSCKCLWMSHGTHMKKSRHTYKWVMSHIWTSHVAHEFVMWHIWMRHVTYVNDSCRPYEYVMTHMNESWHVWKIHLSHIQLLTDHASAKRSRLVYESNGLY